MVDRNNPSDDQWWALLKKVKEEPELLLGHFTNKSTQLKVQEKWASIAIELNLMKQGNHGCTKPADGWRNSWNSLKGRSRKAALNKNRKKRNALFEKVYELVGPLQSEPGGDPIAQFEEVGEVVPVGPPLHTLELPLAPEDNDLMWADLANPVVVPAHLYPVVQVKQEIADASEDELLGLNQGMLVKQEIADDSEDELLGLNQGMLVKQERDLNTDDVEGANGQAPEPLVITLDETPIKTPVQKKGKQLHTPPSGPGGAIPKRRLNYQQAIVPAQPEEPPANQNELTRAIKENTQIMLRLIDKLDSVSLLPL